MKTLAAILVEQPHPLEITDLEIPALRHGQVLVEIAAYSDGRLRDEERYYNIKTMKKLITLS